MKLRYLLYASRLCKPMSTKALCTLLETSQIRNAEAGLTGFLHIEDQVVLQYLEGPSAPLSATVERIRKDPRHDDFAVLAEDLIERRHFDHWQMALVESTTLSLFDLLGVKVTDLPLVKEANPVDLITLLSANASFLRDRPAVG